MSHKFGKFGICVHIKIGDSLKIFVLGVQIAEVDLHLNPNLGARKLMFSNEK